MLLSALDLSPIPSGTTAAGAVANTIDLARHVEALGFRRFWLAEHHNAGALASSSPEILIGAVAAATRRIRVGSGGVMLPNHSPLKVAENFRVLVALHGDRIDLGFGRAAGTDSKTALALRRAPELVGSDRYPEQVNELLGFIAHEPDPERAFGPIKAVPIGVPPPLVFLLGSSTESARFAATLGVGFAFAQHIAGDGQVEALRSYRADFRPSRWFERPHAIVTAAVLCAADDRAAEDLVRCADLASLRFGQGLRDQPFPSIEEARAYVFDDDEEALRRGSPVIAGGPERVGERLHALVASSGADELMVTTHIHDHEERKRSYDRLAAIFA